MKELFSKNPTNSISIFNPADISLKDDAFHVTKGRFFAEWWYFDAVFNNGYSLNAILIKVSRGKIGLVIPLLAIYKDLKLIFNRRELYCNKEFVASEEIPYVEISKKNIMKSHIDRDTNNWIYNIKMDVGGQKIDLEFTGFMKGWKGKTPVSMWEVVLPKALVKGNITINNEKIDVEGTGYHDHNWDLSLPIKQKGWCWGRVEGDLLNLVWSKILLKKNQDFLLAVLNIGNSDYINIDPGKILIKELYNDDNDKKGMPNELKFQIIDDTNSIDININMTTIKVFHHVKLPIINYWRAHVKTTGHLKYRERNEKIDRIQMIEYVKIR